MKIKGNGCVRQIKDSHGKPVKNSWQLVVSLGCDPLTGKRKQACRNFHGTKTEARKALGEYRRELEHGLRIDADKVTFGEYSAAWLEERKASGRFAPATIKRNEQVLVRLNRYLANVTLSDIDASTVRNLYVALAKNGVGQTTMAKAGITLKQILRQAVNDDIILRNPCDRAEAPKQPKTKAGQSLDKRGLQRLLRTLKELEDAEYPHSQLPQQRHTIDMSHITAVRLAIATGLRRGEVLGLSWEDIDLASAILKVRHSLCETTGELKEPKSESGLRSISLDAQTVEDLAKWKRLQAIYLLSLGIKQSAESPVIINETGGRIRGTNLSRWWRTFCKENGFEGLRFHDLRHTHATMLVSSGLNIKAVSERIGHASVGLTLDLYSHAQREDDMKAAAIIGDIIAEPEPPLARVVNL